jgi:hypothetical protein
MAEIAQIYLLPPPVRPPATDRALAPRGSTGGASTPADSGAQDGSVQAGSSEQARARRFRFRVHEGGETSDTGTELATRRTGSNPALTASGIDLGNSDSLESQSGRSGRSTGPNTTLSKPNTGASSAFLAQSIAQEQLGEGLHNPPYAAASTAYSRTGAALTPAPSAGVNITA